MQIDRPKYSMNMGKINPTMKNSIHINDATTAKPADRIWGKQICLLLKCSCAYKCDRVNLRWKNFGSNDVWYWYETHTAEEYYTCKTEWWYPFVCRIFEP